MASRRISANAIQALKDALTEAFWFKKDLYGYAKAAVAGEPLFLAGIGWTDPDVYKRDSVSLFVDRLVREQDSHPELLLAVMMDVAAMEDFPQLRRVEDSGPKILKAKTAVQHLRTVIKPYEQAVIEEREALTRIEANRAATEDRRATARRLEELMARYMELIGAPPQARGYALEKLLRDLFDCFDLDPRAAFKITGEQIDGGFSLDQEHFLVEARWENEPADRDALDVFDAKVRRKAENTLGLFVAISGFNPNAVEIHSGAGSCLILLEGGDLYAVLDQRIDLRDLLRRKRRHAAMTGGILFTAGQALGNT